MGILRGVYPRIKAKGFYGMKNHPDNIYVNGQIITMEPSLPSAPALAIRRGRIVDIGEQDRIFSLAGKKTKVDDLGGRTLIPGFIDAHSHFLHAGLYDSFLVNLKSPPLGSIKNIDDLVVKLRQAALSTPEPDWIIGYGYDDTLLEEKRHPNAKDLNRADATHPIFIRHVSGHLAVMNSIALKLTGIDKATHDPFGGRIQRDEQTAEPTGILDGEPAMQLAEDKLPPWDEKHWLKAVGRASNMYAAKGITTAQEGDAQSGDLETLLLGHDRGLLSLRVQLYPNWGNPTGLANYPSPICGSAITEDRMLVVGGVKMYQDGSLQGYSGYLSNPYYKQLYPQKQGALYRGRPRNSRAELNANVEKAHREGWQIAVHANGDQAIQDVIDAFENAQKQYPRDDARHIIIHCQTVREDQLDKMQTLGIVPSFFTTHIYFWGDRHWNIFLGPERTGRLDPCRSAMIRQMPFTCHNDTYVTPIDPLLSVWSAVNRVSEQGRVIGPEFRVPVMEALRSVTSYAAYQGHEEKFKGTLAPGKYADMTLLEDNPLTVEPLAIKDIRISATMVGGNVIFGSI
jgi:predicted amidohydrolase YtcJ